MKNILVYFNWQLILPFYGIMIDHINKLTKDGHKVYLLSCDGIIKNCYSNPLNDPQICKLCVFVKKAGYSSLYGNVKHIVLESYSHGSTNLVPFKFESIEDIKNLNYKEVKIGYGALSSYVSYTRNQEPVFNEEFSKYINDFLTSQVNIVNALENLTKELEFSEVFLYNGRWADVRPVYDYFNNKKIYVGVIESVNNGTTEFYKEVYPNVLPQDIDFRTKEIHRVWNDSQKTEQEKFLEAENFFISKRNALDPRGDIKVFTADHEDKLPLDFNNNKINITIFNSSEDEFMALGSEWEQYRIFKTQEEGIESICSNFEISENIHFYLRVHPNLKAVKYGYVSRLLELQKKYKNLTVIPPDSKISSYKLLDNSNKVIVFGSSIGFEAAYVNKPVILLGGTFYYFLNTTYTPKTSRELYELISATQLESKPKIGAYMFAYYLMNHKKFSQLIELNPKPMNLFNKQIFHYFTFTKLLGSSLLFRFIYQIWFSTLKIHTKLFNKKTIPNIGL